MWELDHNEGWAPKNWCFWTVVLEKTLESPLDSKEIQPVHLKGNQSWIFIGRTELKLKLQYFGHLMQGTTPWERPWCWERLKAGGERGNRRWDGWMASPTRWTWVWVSSGSWWWTGKPGVLQSTGSPRVRHYWATELQWISESIMIFLSLFFNTELNLEVLFLLITPAISPSKCPLTSSVL